MTKTKKKALKPVQAKVRHKRDAKDAAILAIQMVYQSHLPAQPKSPSSPSNPQPLRPKTPPSPLKDWWKQLNTELHQLASATKFFSTPGNKNPDGCLLPCKTHDSLVLAVTMLQNLSEATGRKLTFEAKDVKSLSLMSERSLVRQMAMMIPSKHGKGPTLSEAVPGNGIASERCILKAATNHIRQLQGRAPLKTSSNHLNKNRQADLYRSTTTEQQFLQPKSKPSKVPETHKHSFPVQPIVKRENRFSSPSKVFDPPVLGAIKQEHLSFMAITKIEDDLCVSEKFKGSYEQQTERVSGPEERHLDHFKIKTQSEHEVEQALLKIDKWATAWLDGKFNHNPANLNIPHQPQINAQRMESAEVYYRAQEFTSNKGFEIDTHRRDVFRDEWDSIQYCLSIPDIEILEEGEVSDNENYSHNDERNKINLDAGKGTGSRAWNPSKFLQRSTCKAG